MLMKFMDFDVMLYGIGWGAYFFIVYVRWGFRATMRVGTKPNISLINVF